jgi:hypothetical protein
MMTELEALKVLRDLARSKVATLHYSHYRYQDGDDYRQKFEQALARVDKMIAEREPTIPVSYVSDAMQVIIDMHKKEASNG